MFSLSGAVVKGKGEGRAIGYPTANIVPRSARDDGAVVENILDWAPGTGVWTCVVQTKDGEYQGLAVIGMWKLPNGLPSVEVHLLDFNQDLYSQVVTVTLLAKLRDLARFTDTQSLVIQIEKDIAIARAAFETKI